MTQVAEAPPPGESIEPICTIDYAASHITPELIAALARAQASLETVGKAAWQSEKGYDYATADAVVGSLRRALAPQGLALVSSFAHWPLARETRVKESAMWLDWHVRLDWCLLHAGADRVVGSSDVGAGVIEVVSPARPGMLLGHAHTVAVGGKGRPPDKSLYAARTSLTGYVALGLGAMDRAIVPKAENLDERDDDKGAPEQLSPREVRKQIDKAMAAIKQARRAHGLRMLSDAALVDLVNGEPFRPSREAFLDLLERADAVLDDMGETLAAWETAEATVDDPTVGGAP
jgi:hypothetical protein